MLTCKECYLWKQSQYSNIFANFVDGVGNKNADIMLVIDNPFMSDVTNDKLFSEMRYRKMLNSFLKEVNLTIDDIYITSYLKCIPTDKNKKPTKPAKEKCFGLHLEKELREIKPKVVMLCGSMSCKKFIDGFANMKQAVGNKFYSKKYNCYFLPIFNFFYLANLTEQSIQYRDTKRSFRNIAYCVEKPPVDLKFEYSSKYDDLKNLDELVAVDTETTGLDFMTDKILTICISDKKSNVVFDTDEIDWSKIIPELNKRKLILQNAIFDFKFIKQLGYSVEDRLVADTKLMQFLINPTGATGLGFLVQLYFQYAYKEEVDIVHMEKMTKEQRKIRCVKDTYFTYRLFFELYKKLKSQESIPAFKVFVALIKVLTNLEFKGLLMDKEKIEELIIHYSKERDTVLQNFKKKLKLTKDFNLNSHKQLKELLFEKLKLPILTKTKSKNPACDVKAIKKLINKKPILQKILDYRENKGMVEKLEKQYKGYIREDGRIHGSFDMFSPNSSRIMMKKPNCQNVNRGGRIKEIFIPAIGYSYAYFDFSQVEFRIWVHLSQDKMATKFINEGKDIHKFIASRFWRIGEEEVTKEQRDLIKTVVYGTMYARTPESIAEEHKILLDHAQKIQRIVFGICKEGYFWLKDIEQKVLKDKKLKTPFGSYRFFSDIDFTFGSKKEQQLREAKNYIIQSWAAEIVFIAMYKIYRQIKIEGLDAGFVHQQHDMGMLEVKDSELKRVVEIIKEKANNPVKLTVPITVEIKTGKSWAGLNEIE